MIAIQRTLFHCIVMAILTIWTPTGHAMLVNPGFESGEFTGWTVVNFGGGGSGVGTDGSGIPDEHPVFDPALVNVRSGSFAAYAVVAAFPAGEYLSLSQTLTLAPGEYRTGFFMGNDSASMFGIESPIDSQPFPGIFVNGVLEPFDIRFPDNNFPTGATPADMFEFSSRFSSSGGLTTIEYRISGSGTARAGISVDDFFLVQQMPEPSTLVLLAAGFSALGRMRRRTTH